MGPLISQRSVDRVQGYIDKGQDEGGRLVLDRRNVRYEKELPGYFVGPCIFDGVTPDMTIAREEIFGPVGAFMPVGRLEDAFDRINNLPYGNAASIFTTNGRSAREFKYHVRAGNLGVNVGVPAPMAFFPFAGMKDSFFGTLHGQGREAIDFFTDRKVVITRW